MKLRMPAPVYTAAIRNVYFEMSTPELFFSQERPTVRNHYPTRYGDVMVRPVEAETTR